MCKSYVQLVAFILIIYTHVRLTKNSDRLCPYVKSYDMLHRRQLLHLFQLFLHRHIPPPLFVFLGLGFALMLQLIAPPELFSALVLLLQGMVFIFFFLKHRLPQENFFFATFCAAIRRPDTVALSDTCFSELLVKSHLTIFPV